MKSTDYYQGKDLPSANSFYFNSIVSAVFVDMGNVKEVKFTGAELQTILNSSGEILGWGSDSNNLLISTPPYKVRKEGGEALKSKVTQIANIYQKANKDSIGELVFKSLDFDLDGFNSAEDQLAKQNRDRMDEFRKDAEESHGMEGFSDELKAIIHQKAWDHGKSSGLNEVFNSYSDYVEVAEAALKR